jgi:hypothetical protein
MTPKSIFWTLLAIVASAMLVIAPNALWLSRSSAIIHNTGEATMTLRLVIVGPPDRIIDAGELAPGTSRFQWIDLNGEATLTVEAHDGVEWQRHCVEYVEAGMYRVEVAARAPDDVACQTDLPLLDRLLILDYLQ